MKHKNKLKIAFKGARKASEHPEPFSNFSINDWIVWIEDVLNKKNDHILFSENQIETHRALVDIYRSLEDKIQSRYFSEAIGVLLKSTIPIENNSERIYHLLLVTVYVRPLNVSSLLKKWLIEQSLIDFDFAGQNLHTLLFSVVSKFGLDDDIIDFLKVSGSKTNDFPFLLVAFRSLFTAKVQYALEYLEIIIPKLKNKLQVMQLSDEIEYFLVCCGGRQLYNWYENIHLLMEKKSKIKFYRFETALAKASKNYLKTGKNETIMAFPSLLSELIKSRKAIKLYDPNQLLKIARMHEIVGVDNVIMFLKTLWERTKHLGPSKLAWCFDPPVGEYSSPECIITNDIGNAKFMVNEEPILYEIFKRVREEAVDSIRTPASTQMLLSK